MELVWFVGGVLVAGVALYVVMRPSRPTEPARDRLRDAIGAAAAETLRSNSEQFAQLVRSDLERVQTAAATDLEKRERAIPDGGDTEFHARRRADHYATTKGGCGGH